MAPTLSIYSWLFYHCIPLYPLSLAGSLPILLVVVGFHMMTFCSLRIFYKVLFAEYMAAHCLVGLSKSNRNELQLIILFFTSRFNSSFIQCSLGQATQRLVRLPDFGVKYNAISSCCCNLTLRLPSLSVLLAWLSPASTDVRPSNQKNRRADFYLIKLGKQQSATVENIH